MSHEQISVCSPLPQMTSLPHAGPVLPETPDEKTPASSVNCTPSAVVVNFLIPLFPIIVSRFRPRFPVPLTIASRCATSSSSTSHSCHSRSAPEATMSCCQISHPLHHESFPPSLGSGRSSCPHSCLLSSLFSCLPVTSRNDGPLSSWFCCRSSSCIHFNSSFLLRS